MAPQHTTCKPTFRAASIALAAALALCLGLVPAPARAYDAVLAPLPASDEVVQAPQEPEATEAPAEASLTPEEPEASPDEGHAPAAAETDAPATADVPAEPAGDEAVTPPDDAPSEDAASDAPASDATASDDTPAPAEAPCGDEATPEEAPASKPEPAPETASAPAPAATTAQTLVPQATDGLPAAPTGATAKAVTDGRTYVIQSLVASNRVVAAASSSAKAGTGVVTATYSGKNAQKWVVRREGSSLWYRLLLAGSAGKLALGVSGSKVCIVKNPTGGSKLLSVLWSFVSTGSGTYRLVSAGSTTKALEVAGSAAKAGTALRTAAAASSQPSGQGFRMVDAAPKVAKGTSGLAGAYTIAPAAAPSLVTGTKAQSRAQSAALTLQVSDGSQTQRIYLEPDGKGYYIAWVIGSGRVLTVSGASILPGTKVVQRSWKGAEHQRWALVATKRADGTYTATLRNKGTGLYLGAAATKSGTLATGQAAGGANTKLTLTKQGLLSAGITCITPLSTTANAVSIPGAKTGTAKVALWTNSGAINQRFQLVSAGSNLWRIRTGSSGGWLTWKGGTTVRQEGSSQTAKSKANTWKAVWKKGGIVLVNRASGKALQMSYGKTKRGTQIVAYKSTGSAAQHFAFNPAQLIADGVYLVGSKWSGRRLRVDGGSETPANLSNPTAAKTANASEKFRFTSVGSSYKITNVKSGLVVAGGGMTDASGYANVSQKRNAGTKDQLWKAQIGDGGYVEFVNVASGKYLVSRNSNSKSADGIWPAYNVVERDAKQKSTYTTGCSWRLTATTGTVKKNPVAGTTVLMVGNSFTGVSGRHKVYEAVQAELGSSALVDWVTKSATTLAQHYNTASNGSERELAIETLKKLYFGDWDVVVIQEKTSVPLQNYSSYLTNLRLFVNASKKVKATPVIYGTYAFAGGSGGATELGLTRAQMTTKLQAVFNDAHQATGAVVADVAAAFKAEGFDASLYDTDDKHPSALGACLAGKVIASTVRKLV